MTNFDISVSFDNTPYLDSEIYLFFDTLEHNIPDDTTVHITSNRDAKDKVMKWIGTKDINFKWYYKEDINLVSRCRYLMHSLEIETDKDWIIKMDLDTLILKNLSEFDLYLNDAFMRGYDIAIQPENRRIVPDDRLEFKLWRILYRAMDIDLPRERIRFIEDKDYGLPLFSTGTFAIQSHHIDKINKRWVDLTRKCENWIGYNIHPNEFAFTAMVYDYGWRWKELEEKFNYNPIGHYRDGEYPITELKDYCPLPRDIVLLHYHKPQWLMHLAKRNPHIMEIIGKTSNNVPKSWWNLDNSVFKEKTYGNL